MAAPDDIVAYLIPQGVNPSIISAKDFSAKDFGDTYPGRLD